MGFGAGDNDTKLFTGGALEALETLAGGKDNAQQAIQLAQSLSPEREKIKPAMAAFKFFSQMAIDASQPGATGIGSAASALRSPIEYLEGVGQYNRKLDAATGTTAVSLAQALKPPKTTGAGSTTYKSIIIKMKDGTEKQDYVLVGDIAAIKALPNVVSVKEDKTSNASGGAKKASSYSVSSENLVKVAGKIGYTPPTDILGNILLDPEQYLLVRDLVGSETKKEAQGSAFERNFNTVNDIGTRIAAFTLDPNLPAISQEELNEYSTKYQKLVLGGEYTEEVNGQQVTRRRAGIDLEGTTNLPIPAGLDLNAIIEERRQQFDQGQNTNATFGSRMLYSEGIIRNVMAEGYVLTVEDLARIATMGRLGLGTIGLNPLAKQYHVAAQNWLAAQLRNESGAAIAASEYADALLQYFPVVGDDADTIKQKQALREANVRGMIQSSQGAFEVIYPSGTQYLSYTSAEGATYDNVLNAQGYANQLLTNTDLGNTLFFSDGLRLKTTEALRAMLANPNASTLFTSQMIDMINEEIAREGR